MKQIHGKVTFVTEKDGRLVSSQARGHNGKRWIETVLLFYGIFYGRVEFNRVVARAAKRLEKSERDEERRKARRKA